MVFSCHYPDYLVDIFHVVWEKNNGSVKHEYSFLSTIPGKHLPNCTINQSKED